MYRLYGRKGAGSVAVQVLLEEAGVPYQMVWVEDVKSADFLELNPNGKVPALELPSGQFVYESAAMMIFLAQVLPGARMAPAAGSAEHALMLQWIVLLATGTYETALRYFYSDRYGEATSVKAAASAELDRIYGVMEAALAGRGPYLCGAQITAADPYLAMLVSWYEPDLACFKAKFPRLGALHAAVAERPSWQKVQAANAG